MKKRAYGSDDVITVYKFMARCGLECPTYGNICVSHKIMMRKLRDRHEKFPTKVLVPRVIPLNRITKDDVKRGEIVLVIDDCRNILAYQIDRNQLLQSLMANSNNMEEDIFEDIIDDEIEEEKDTEELKPGFVKYLKRKEKKMEG